MKKLTVVFLIMILCFSLVGCGITTPVDNDRKYNEEVKEVESVVYDYFRALNKLDWFEAEILCVEQAHSDTLTMQDEIESTVGKLTWHWKIDITDTIVDESLAEVHFNFNVKIKVTRVSGGYDHFEVTKEDAVFHLKKSAWGIWLIYDSYLPWEVSSETVLVGDSYGRIGGQVSTLDITLFIPGPSSKMNLRQG